MNGKVVIATLLCALLVSFPGPAGPAGKASEEDAVRMVEVAGKLIEQKGDAALALISDPSGGCCDRDKGLYVSVYSDAAVLIADSIRPDIVGESFRGNPAAGEKDPVMINHYRVSEVMVRKAVTEGSGWTDYSCILPGSDQTGVKHTYSKLFRYGDKNYIVCCGVSK